MKRWPKDPGNLTVRYLVESIGRTFAQKFYEDRAEADVWTIKQIYACSEMTFEEIQGLATRVG